MSNNPIHAAIHTPLVKLKKSPKKEVLKRIRFSFLEVLVVNAKVNENMKYPKQ
jgi:hypothetical protein